MPVARSPHKPYDNALAETVNGLFTAELVWPRGPWRDAAHLELATAAWVAWWNAARLHGALGHVPPLEYEHAHAAASVPASTAPAA
ncbi:MAG TPA: integrase core domain-containing protein [Acidimicrobiales bacterium]|nr:integrase core domain-containing protein [Acidimicrobiales bacterium]